LQLSEKTQAVQYPPFGKGLLDGEKATYASPGELPLAGAPFPAIRLLVRTRGAVIAEATLLQPHWQRTGAIEPNGKEPRAVRGEEGDDLGVQKGILYGCHAQLMVQKGHRRGAGGAAAGVDAAEEYVTYAVLSTSAHNVKIALSREKSMRFCTPTQRRAIGQGRRKISLAILFFFV